ncbi:MAG: Lrp/AsnC family transcriptional regulator [Aigarchaeota archaeon]|nr:Lrp/AsnC family transcriptional regulator [Candidatus Pelearchaeum maunauluense]
MQAKLDEKDQRILQELLQDSSQSITTLASKLKMPRTTVQERIKRLKSQSIIKKFTVRLDYAKMGKPTTAFILVSFVPGSGISQKKLAEEIAAMDDVVEVHLISGEWDILLKVRGESMQSIGSLVIDKLRSIEGVGKTVTCVSFSAVKEEL